MIIANRFLRLRREDDVVAVAVRIFAPQPDQSDWSYAYEIDWPEGARKFTAFGRRSVQALVLALSMVGSEIYTSEYHKAGDLSSDELWKGYGFPVPQNLGDLLIGDDAKYF